jgi:AraC family transcriptional regulator
MEPRIVERGEILLVGLVEHAGYGDIAATWQRFLEHDEPIPAAIDGHTFELHSYPDGHVCGAPFWLMVGVEAERLEPLPPALHAKLLPSRRYAVFTHRLADGGFEGANEPIEQWLAASGTQQDRSFDMQVFDQRFLGPHDPDSILEFWVPLAPQG